MNAMNAVATFGLADFKALMEAQPPGLRPALV
jgi:hypothetical protein